MDNTVAFLFSNFYFLKSLYLKRSKYPLLFSNRLPHKTYSLNKMVNIISEETLMF